MRVRLFAQQIKKERPYFRRHIIAFTPGYELVVSEEHHALFGMGYTYRVSPVYGVSVTAVGGPSIHENHGTTAVSRFLFENRFNIRAENRVQPVFTIGAHFGTSAVNEGSGYKTVVTGGVNFGTGAEVLFAKKRWMAGFYPKCMVTIGTVRIVDLSFYFQAALAYRI